MFTAPNIRYHYLGDVERAKTLRQRGARLVPILQNASSFRQLQQNKIGPYNYETEGVTLAASHVGNHVDVFITAQPVRPLLVNEPAQPAQPAQFKKYSPLIVLYSHTATMYKIYDLDEGVWLFEGSEVDMRGYLQLSSEFNLSEFSVGWYKGIQSANINNSVSHSCPSFCSCPSYKQYPGTFNYAHSQDIVSRPDVTSGNYLSIKENFSVSDLTIVMSYDHERAFSSPGTGMLTENSSSTTSTYEPTNYYTCEQSCDIESAYYDNAAPGLTTHSIEQNSASNGLYEGLSYTMDSSVYNNPYNWYIAKSVVTESNNTWTWNSDTGGSQITTAFQTAIIHGVTSLDMTAVTNIEQTWIGDDSPSSYVIDDFYKEYISVNFLNSNLVGSDKDGRYLSLQSLGVTMYKFAQYVLNGPTTVIDNKKQITLLLKDEDRDPLMASWNSFNAHSALSACLTEDLNQTISFVLWRDNTKSNTYEGSDKNSDVYF